MLEAHKITHLHDGDSYLEVVVSFDERQKSRYLSKTVCGQEFGWFIERGRVLNGADALECTDGTLIKIVCADEDVSQVESNDKHLLMRIAYHLGNRHVPLQVDENFLRYQRDYVLDDMVKGLGINVRHIDAPFHPESGAYTSGSSSGSSHGHSHAHGHSH